ncbi:MAG TPA: hypothetical protein VFZ66_06860 [Herpetosiphonaceae bacterium]
MKPIGSIILLLMIALLTACGGAGPEIGAAATPSATTGAAPTTQPTATPDAPTATFVPTPVAAVATDTPAPATQTTAALATPTAQPTAAATSTAVPSATATPGQPTPLPAPGTTPDGIAIRPDLSGTLAFVRDGDIYAYQPQTGAVRRLIENGRDVQFSRDGTQIAFIRDDGLYLAAADGSNIRRIAEQSGIVSPQWADDGSKIAFERGDDPARRGSGEIWTVELPGGTPLKIATGADPAWAPDSKRLAYVTEATGDPRRGQVRLTNWLGQNDWGVIRSLPPGLPPIGIPGEEIPPDRLEHLLFTPVWDATGAFIYAPAFVGYQALTDFSIWQRADARNGGSTFLGQLPGVMDAFASPNRQAVVFTVGSARGDITLLTRSLDPNIEQQYAWAEYQELANSDAPAWSPGSDALAFFRCSFEPPDRCDLVVAQPGRSEPAALIPDVFGGKGPDREDGLALSWGR